MFNTRMMLTRTSRVGSRADPASHIRYAKAHLARARAQEESPQLGAPPARLPRIRPRDWQDADGFWIYQNGKDTGVAKRTGAAHIHIHSSNQRYLNHAHTYLRRVHPTSEKPKG